MRLDSAIRMYSGGPGSGCHGPNCGRKAGGAASMSRREYVQQRLKETPFHGRLSVHVRQALIHQALRDHEREVKKAFARGETVPHEVMMEYPGIFLGGKGLGSAPGRYFGSAYIAASSEDDIFCIDFDDTLWDDGKKRLNPEAMSVAKWLIKKGFKIVVLTARPVRKQKGISALLDKNGVDVLQVTNTKPPAAGYLDNKAFHWNGKAKEVISEIQKKLSSDVHAGGPGSGCKGDRCGRPSTGHDSYRSLKGEHNRIKDHPARVWEARNSDKARRSYTTIRPMLNSLYQRISAHADRFSHVDSRIGGWLSNARKNLERADSHARVQNWSKAIVSQDNALQNLHWVLNQMPRMRGESAGTQSLEYDSSESDETKAYLKKKQDKLDKMRRKVTPFPEDKDAELKAALKEVGHWSPAPEDVKSIKRKGYKSGMRKKMKLALHTQPGAVPLQDITGQQVRRVPSGRLLRRKYATG